MKKQASFRKTTGWLLILSVPLAFANFALNGIAGGDEMDLYFFYKIGAEAGQLTKWSWLADMFGYYLLLLPAAILLHYWLKDKNPYWMGIFTLCGLGYIFSGSMGAAVLAKTWPTLISGYASADELAKETFRIVFTNTTEIVYGGIWSFYEFLLAGVWWIGIGFALRSERRSLGYATIILGIFAITTTIGEIFTLHYVAFIALLVLLLFAPIWAGWLGISLLRGKDIQLTNP